MSNPLFSERAFPAAASPFSRTATAPAIPLSSAKAIRRCAGRTIRREGKAAWALVTGHGARYRQPHHRAVSGNQSIEQKKGETMRFRPFSPIFTIYLTNCVLPISRDTNLTPKCSHSLQQFRCVLLLRTENVNVCVVCCRNIRMAKPLADYADRYARFQCPRSKGMSQLM